MAIHLTPAGTEYPIHAQRQLDRLERLVALYVQYTIAPNRPYSLQEAAELKDEMWFLVSDMLKQPGPTIAIDKPLAALDRSDKIP